MCAWYRSEDQESLGRVLSWLSVESGISGVVLQDVLIPKERGRDEG